MGANRQNTAIVVVSYNPEITFIDTISVHKTIADTIIVVDNNSSNKNQWEKDIIGVEIINLDKNFGIGKALNIGIRRAKALKKEYVLTFDQDSIPLKNILTLYSDYLNPNVALIGTNYAEYASPVSKVSACETLTIITSGCLHNLKLLEKIGPYDERLFIDGVDFDFALRTKKAGYIVLKSISPLISHHLGNPIKKWNISSTNHSSFRRYFFARNNVILTRKYIGSFPIWILKKNYNFILDIIKIFLVEADKKDKLKKVLEGLKDGINLKIRKY